MTRRRNASPLTLVVRRKQPGVLARQLKLAFPRAARCSATGRHTVKQTEAAIYLGNNAGTRSSARHDRHDYSLDPVKRGSTGVSDHRNFRSAPQSGGYEAL
jgi:hypothetical protein